MTSWLHREPGLSDTLRPCADLSQGKPVCSRSEIEPRFYSIGSWPVGLTSQIDCAIAAGSDTVSDPPIELQRRFAKRLVNVMDAYVLGAVPPYNMLLGGKLVASLVRSPRHFGFVSWAVS